MTERELAIRRGETKWDALQRVVNGLLESADNDPAVRVWAVKAAAYRRVRTVMYALEAQEAVQGGEEGRLDWPAARKAIDSAMERARREIRIVVSEALGELPIADGKRAADAILAQVKDDDDD